MKDNIKKIVNVLIVKEESFSAFRALKDFMFIFLACYFLDVFHSMFFLGLDKTNLWLSIFDGLFYGIIVFVVLQITYRIFKSILLLSATCTLVFLSLIGRDIASVSSHNKSLRLGGDVIFDYGDVTTYGYLYLLFTPIFFACLYFWLGFFIKKSRKL